MPAYRFTITLAEGARSDNAGAHRLAIEESLAKSHPGACASVVIDSTTRTLHLSFALMAANFDDVMWGWRQVLQDAILGAHLPPSQVLRLEVVAIRTDDFPAAEQHIR